MTTRDTTNYLTLSPRRSSLVYDLLCVYIRTVFRMSDNPFQIFAVSDATGKLAYELAVAASRQFEGINVKIARRPRVSSIGAIRKVLGEAGETHGVILFTMVSQELRRELLSHAKEAGIVAMDVMGPALDLLSNYFHKLPSAEPGLQYKTTQDYYKRTESIEFAVKHDDGLGMETIDQADMILLGVSRCSKTPLSIYLAYQGYRCANVPIMLGVPLPEKIFTMDRKKMVGLTVSAEGLSTTRLARLKKLGRPESELYAQKGHVEQELACAAEVFDRLKGIPVIDMTGKAIEEIAAETLHALSLSS